MYRIAGHFGDRPLHTVLTWFSLVSLLYCYAANLTLGGSVSYHCARWHGFVTAGSAVSVILIPRRQFMEILVVIHRHGQRIYCRILYAWNKDLSHLSSHEEGRAKTNQQCEKLERYLVQEDLDVTILRLETFRRDLSLRSLQKPNWKDRYPL